MDYAVLGGDMRFAHLVSMLNESGRNAKGFLQEQGGGEEYSLEELKKYSCIISNWPMRAPLSKREADETEILGNIAPGSVLLLCGPKFPKNRRWDLQYVNLWEDEELLKENAYLTAEGAVAGAIQRLGGKLQDVNCAVVGYGRIGQALCEILLKLGARVTVVSGKDSKRRIVRQSGAEVAALEDICSVMSRKELVFSTPPAEVIGRNALRCADPDAIIIDLASPPYGVDLESARELGLQAYREPGLPGRYCPLSAARAIYGAVVRWEEKNHEI